MATIYHTYADEDGLLYMIYSEENVVGWKKSTFKKMASCFKFLLIINFS